jgi:capsular polysaccharide biosynthesis protein
MNLFSKLTRNFFWKSNGVSPMQLLDASQGVLARHDVTAKVAGENHGYNPLTAVELADGKVVGSVRLAATRENIVVENVQNITGCHDLKNHSALRQRRFRMPKYRRGTALLLGAPSSDCNYYHWVIDSLPRWKIMQAANYSDYDYVLLQEGTSRFQDEFLDQLGVPVSKRLHCSKKQVHQFERLVVPAMPVLEWKVPPWACAWLRSLFPEKNSGPEKIYISRRNAPQRRLINEAELEKGLQAIGFESLQLEQLPIAEQAGLFNSVKCVVAPHGAGLTNLAFAPVGALVVELCASTDTLPCYKNLAIAAGLRYVAVIGNPADKSVSEGKDFGVEVSTVVRAVVDNL